MAFQDENTGISFGSDGISWGDWSYTWGEQPEVYENPEDDRIEPQDDWEYFSDGETYMYQLMFVGLLVGAYFLGRK